MARKPAPVSFTENGTDPQGITAYRLGVLAADVTGLMDAAGQAQVHLVGHDWGGVIAWWMAIHAPHRLQRMVVINAPHGATPSRSAQ